MQVLTRSLRSLPLCRSRGAEGVLLSLVNLLLEAFRRTLRFYRGLLAAQGAAADTLLLARHVSAVAEAASDLDVGNN